MPLALLALLDALLWVAGGFGIVVLTILVFLLITKVVAPRILDDDDGSSL